MQIYPTVTEWGQDPIYTPKARQTPDSQILSLFCPCLQVPGTSKHGTLNAEDSREPRTREVVSGPEYS